VHISLSYSSLCLLQPACPHDKAEYAPSYMRRPVIIVDAWMSANGKVTKSAERSKVVCVTVVQHALAHP